jgi:hypothetical protein
MRSHVLVYLVLALMLAACGAKPPPAATVASEPPIAQPALTEAPSPTPQPTSPPTAIATPAPTPTPPPTATTTAVPLAGKPGAAGIGDSYYEDLGNGGYDAEHYTLDLILAKPGEPISATVTMAAQATQDLSAFNLEFNGFDISAVTVDGTPAQYKRDGGELTVALPEPLAAGTSFTATIAYSGTPKPIASRTQLPFKIGWLTGKDVSFVVSEPDAASSWYPVNDHPRDKATYTFRVTVPKPYMAVANGVRKSTMEQADGTTYLWEASDPMASYLATVAIGKFEVSETPGPDGLTVRTYYPAAAAKETAAAFGAQAEALSYFSELFGPYPFESYGIVVVDAAFDSALEIQTLPIFGRDVLGQGGESTAIEELAHQWFGDSVSPANWQDVWLNEGFAVYATWLWKEHILGPTALDQEVRQAYDAFTIQGVMPVLEGAGVKLKGVSNEKIDQVIASTVMSPPAEPPEDNLFNRGVYDRGALALHALRLRVGDEAFFQILREYYDQHKYATASTRDFIAIAEKVSRTSLAEFFDLWLYDKSAIPDIPEMKLFHKIGATVKAPNLRVRSGPGTDYGELDTATQGATLRVLGQTTACAWLRVRTAETVLGWVNGGKEFVELSLPCDAIPVAAAPPPPPKPTAKPGSDLTPVSRDQAKQTMQSAVNGVDGTSMAMLMTPMEEMPPILSYHTEISAGGQTQELLAQLKKAVFAAVPGFVRANPPWESLSIWPLPPDGYKMVVITRQAALDWYTGKTDNATFEKTWTTKDFGQ